MKRVIKLMLILLGIGWLAPAAARAQDETQPLGELSGRVLNGSRDSTGVGGQEVMLYIIENGRELDTQKPKVRTDAQGRFVFKNLPLKQGRAYYPLTRYEGVEYAGSVVQANPQQPNLKSDIYIFDSTNSDSAISTAMLHLIVLPGNNGMLEVQELYVFANESPYTYAGKVPLPDQPDKFSVLQFELPEGAQNLQLGGDLMSCCTVIEQNQIIDTMPFKPGKRQVSISYHLPYRSRQQELWWRLPYAVTTLNLLIAEPARMEQTFIIAGGDTLHLQEEKPIYFKGRTYRHYGAKQVAAQAAFMAAVGNLPAPPKDYRWLAPVGLLLLIGFTYVLQQKWKRKSAESRNTAEELRSHLDRRRGLLQQIAELDQQFEDGTLPEATYREQRNRLMEQVLELEAKLFDEKWQI